MEERVLRSGSLRRLWRSLCLGCLNKRLRGSRCLLGAKVGFLEEDGRGGNLLGFRTMVDLLSWVIEGVEALFFFGVLG